jgi:DNA-binding FrmR family transcriptional regulator
VRPSDLDRPILAENGGTAAPVAAHALAFPRGKAGALPAPSFYRWFIMSQQISVPSELEMRTPEESLSEDAFDGHHGTPALAESEQQGLVVRLNRIEGQLRGIRRMVQEPRTCLELLQQLAAAEAALSRISLAVLRHHVQNCVPEGIAMGEPEASKRMKELVDIFDRFRK